MLFIIELCNSYYWTFPILSGPCLKSTAFAPLALPTPPPPHPLPAKRTFIHIQTKITCPLLLSGIVWISMAAPDLSKDGGAVIMYRRIRRRQSACMKGNNKLDQVKHGAWIIMYWMMKHCDRGRYKTFWPIPFVWKFSGIFIVVQ